MALPRFRCAQEYAFIPSKGHGMRRVQLNQEFDYDDSFFINRFGEEIKIPPGPWMDPVNEEAVELVQALVKAKKRKTVSAESVADTVPVQPPKSGISLSLEQSQHTANEDLLESAVRPQRDLPKRRSSSAS